MLELHRSRFVEWQPAAVVALAVAPGGLTVALARETGDLEIYDTTDWRCTARVPGHDGAAVSSLTWCAPFLPEGVEPAKESGGDQINCCDPIPHVAPSPRAGASRAYPPTWRRNHSTHSSTIKHRVGACRMFPP
jgi:hypothetical protein